MKAKVNGIQIHYVERGHGIPVVFIHGFPLSHRMWEPQLLALPDYFRHIAYDVRGHGESECGDGQYTFEWFVDDFFALLDGLHIEKAIVCGLSMGGYIALRAMERNPERFLGVVLCDTRSTADDNTGKLRRAELLQQVKKEGAAVFARHFVPNLFAPVTQQHNPSVVRMMQDIASLHSPTGIAGALLALASRTDTTESLPNIAVPTLLLVGEHDAVTPVSASLAMQSLITNVDMHIIPDAGHLSNLENPAVFNEKLLHFLHRIRQRVMDETA